MSRIDGVVRGGAHSQAVLYDGTAAACFREWRDGVQWLGEIAPGALLDTGGRIWAADGSDLIGEYVDRYDSGELINP
jgi:hypothetical protein